MNFDLANGTPVPAQIPSGSKLKARIPVNVRPGPRLGAALAGSLVRTNVLRSRRRVRLRRGTTCRFGRGVNARAVDPIVLRLDRRTCGLKWNQSDGCRS
jgi:hypothetical protein